MESDDAQHLEQDDVLESHDLDEGLEEGLDEGLEGDDASDDDSDSADEMADETETHIPIEEDAKEPSGPDVSIAVGTRRFAADSPDDWTPQGGGRSRNNTVRYLARTLAPCSNFAATRIPYFVSPCRTTADEPRPAAATTRLTFGVWRMAPKSQPSLDTPTAW